jgi:ribonuclease HI
MKQYEVTIKGRNHNKTKVYSIMEASKGTKLRKYADVLARIGIYKTNQLPRPSKEELQNFILKKDIGSHFSVSTLFEFVNKVFERTNRCTPINIRQQRPTITNLVSPEWNKTTIYTDGGYCKYRNITSFGIVVEEAGVSINNATRFKCSRILGKQDNYRAELIGILRALNHVHRHQEVTIVTDLLSSIDAINNYIKVSKENQMKYNNRGVLDKIACKYTRIKAIKLLHVYGHTGVPGNEIADKLATAALNHKSIDINVAIGTKDQYVLAHRNDSIYRNARNFILEIIRDTIKDKTQYKYDILKESYHSVSQDCATSLDMQMFLAKAKSNQLPTKSKMEYWNKEPTSNRCPRCHTAKEDQLHLLVECKYSEAKKKGLAYKVLQHCNQRSKNATKPLRVWGTNFFIHNGVIGTNETRNQHREYVNLLGLFTKEEINEVERAGYERPSLLARKIARTVVKHSKTIWMARNVYNSCKQ